MKTLGCSAEDFGRTTGRPKQYMAEITYNFFRWALVGMSVAENKRMEAKSRMELAIKKGVFDKVSLHFYYIVLYYIILF